MIVISLTVLLLTLSICYLTYSNRSMIEDLITEMKSSAQAQNEQVNALVKGVKDNNSWQVAAIKRYLGDVLGEAHNPGNDLSNPRLSRAHRKRVVKKPRRAFTPEQKAALSLKAKEMWAKRRESKQGEESLMAK